MANPKTFPTLVPSARSYSPGTYPSTTFESLDGTKTHIRFGNKRVNATLSLSFSNITDAEAASILDNYEEVNSVWDYVEFDLAVGALAGIGDLGELTDRTGQVDLDLMRYMKEENSKGTRPSGLKWRYSGPPSVTSVRPGISNVSCSFVACLDAPI